MTNPRSQNEQNGLPANVPNRNGDHVSEFVRLDAESQVNRDHPPENSKETREPFDAISELLELSSDRDSAPPEHAIPPTSIQTNSATQMQSEVNMTAKKVNHPMRESPERPALTQAEIDATDELQPSSQQLLATFAQSESGPLEEGAAPPSLAHTQKDSFNAPMPSEAMASSSDAPEQYTAQYTAQYSEQSDSGDRSAASSSVSQSPQKAFALVKHSNPAQPNADLGVPMTRLERQDRRSSGRQNQAKPAVFALAIAMLPILLAGTATYFAGRSVIDEQTTQLQQETLLDPAEIEQRQRRHLELLAILSLGTGAMAILVGLIAAGLANRTLRSAIKDTTDQVEQNTHNALSQKSQALTAAVEQLRRSGSQADILEIAVGRIREMLACDRVVVYWSDENLERRVIAESLQLGCSSMLNSVIADPLFIAKYLEPYERGVRVIEDVYQTGESPADQQLFGAYSIQAMMAVPLMIQGERFGFVVAHDCSEPRAWEPAEIDLFHQLTTQVGLALDLAQTASERNDLKEMVALEAQWRSTFDQTTQLIHESLASDEILEAAVIETRRVLACDRVVVYSLNPEHQGVIIAESAAPGCLRAFGRTITDPCFEAKYIEMYADGRVRAVNNIHAANLSPCYVEQLEKLNVKANLVAPIVHEGQLMGLLVAHQCSAPRNWKELEIRWFAQIAVQVGYALDNAKFKQQAEQKAQTFYQEQAGMQAAVSRLLQEAKVTLESLATGSTEHLNTIGTVVDQLQAIAESSRQMATKAQKAEQERRGASQALQSGSTSVNQAVDVITEIQETVAHSSGAIEELGAVAQSIAQIVNLINEAAEPMGQLAINLSISSGRSGDQGAIVDTTEAVLACAQHITVATTQLQPLVDKMGQDTQAIMKAMEMGTEQAVMGTELAKQTRHHLNQLTAYEEKLTVLLLQLVNVIPAQAQTMSSTRQSVQGVLTLTTQTLEKSMMLSDLIQTLETTVQGS
ncbi:MAG: GAF domain-containing protein [Thermosynechococcaceae cyanobacterium]